MRFISLMIVCFLFFIISKGYSQVHPNAQFLPHLQNPDFDILVITITNLEKNEPKTKTDPYKVFIEFQVEEIITGDAKNFKSMSKLKTIWEIAPQPSSDTKSENVKGTISEEPAGLPTVNSKMIIGGKLVDKEFFISSPAFRFPFVPQLYNDIKNTYVKQK